MPRKATIGPAVYERVNALVAEGKSRTEAFAQVGQERGQRPGTVAANYYRTARSQAQTRRATTTRRRRTKTGAAGYTRTRPRATTRTPASQSTRSRASSPSSDLDALAAQIAALTQKLVEQVEERDARLRQLLG